MSADMERIDREFESWISRIDQTGRFSIGPRTLRRMSEISAADYVGSDRLDFDRLSVRAHSIR